MLYLIERMEKNYFSFENCVFLVKVINSPYIIVMRINAIFFVKFDHVLHSLNYSSCI